MEEGGGEEGEDREEGDGEELFFGGVVSRRFLLGEERGGFWEERTRMKVQGM